MYINLHICAVHVHIIRSKSVLYATILLVDISKGNQNSAEKQNGRDEKYSDVEGRARKFSGQSQHPNRRDKKELEIIKRLVDRTPQEAAGVSMTPMLVPDTDLLGDRKQEGRGNEPEHIQIHRMRKPMSLGCGKGRCSPHSSMCE